MWRLVKVGAGAISSGDSVQITVNNPMLKYCQYNDMIICGVKSDVASNFVIEKASGSGVIDFATDDVVFKYDGKYCSLDGRRHSQSIKCGKSSKDKATVFQLPYSSFTGVNLISKTSAGECGGDFYAEADRPPIYCSKNQNLGFAFNLTLGLEEPGAAVVPAGKGLSFKVYDDLYSYQVSNFKTDTDGSVFFATNNVRGDNSFFRLAVVGGGDLEDGAVVTLKAASNGKYCGVKDAFAVSLICDGDSASGDAYKFDYKVL
ncbi:hypothetical protein HYH03_012755 [Edaphochlamys debaryana]|uniref:Uncharacterized protein n=1 Tax=Edaphochlamys debaryana TaxID=47281 RepID=A0A836BU58_9CHLO|nr:hypothetical protein HYH03_012755 [Edaphochlamys debaryana]|eukprot:KAG2488757.1 hypothetical protein HYH03_012755 [Edaphochlamys debaryana]